MNETKVMAFLRKLVLDDASRTSLREEALDLILDNPVEPDTSVAVNIIGYGIVSMKSSTVCTITEQLQKGLKIDAIKTLRYWYSDTFNQETLGLKEAKDTIDSWPISK